MVFHSLIVSKVDKAKDSPLHCRRPLRLSFANKVVRYNFLARYTALLGGQASKSGYVENYVCSSSISSLPLQTFKHPVILVDTAILQFSLKIVFARYTRIICPINKSTENIERYGKYWIKIQLKISWLFVDDKQLSIYTRYLCMKNQLFKDP